MSKTDALTFVALSTLYRVGRLEDEARSRFILSAASPAGGFLASKSVKQKRDDEELQTVLREARESLAELRRATGLSEEELVAEFVPKKHERREAGG